MKFYDDEDDNIPAPRRKKQTAEVEEDPAELRRQEMNRQQEHLRHRASVKIENYNQYMEKVRNGQRPGPFLIEPWEKNSMLKHYRRYVFYFVSKIWIGLHPELELDVPAEFVEAYERITKLNEELVASLKVISSIPKKVITRARKRDNMFIVPKRFHNPFLTRFVAVIGDMELSCVVPECLWKKEVRKLIVLENPPDDADDEPDERQLHVQAAAIDKEKQIVPLCDSHTHFFELIFVLLKMDYNINKNMETWINSLRDSGQITDDMTCKAVCSAIPLPSLKAIVVRYLSIYLKLFAFGTPEDWKKQSSNIDRDVDSEEGEVDGAPEQDVDMAEKENEHSS